MTTFLLVPGAGGDPWFWHRLIPELQARGPDAVPVRLPTGDDTAGWAEYADAIVSAAGAATDIVLVAQSLAGFSAPIAAERLPVSLLVLLNAMIPMPGETGMDWWSNTGSGEAQLEYFERTGLSPADAGNDDVVYFHDLPESIVRTMRQGPPPQQSMTPMDQAFPLSGWPRVRTVVLAGADDRLFPAEFQRRVARDRLGLEVEMIEGGHMAAMSHPRELAERLDALVSDVRV